MNTDARPEATTARSAARPRNSMTSWLARRGPGLALSLVAVGIAWFVHTRLPSLPLLTVCLLLGLIVGQFPLWSGPFGGVVSGGLTLAARRLLRLGIVFLGFKLSFGDILALGWQTLLLVVGIVIATFFLTLGVGKLFRLPGDQPLFIATGFSICGASAIGAVAAITKSKDEETATPIGLVTLFGTLAIVVLPALRYPLGLDSEQFGAWVGASVHDVGQVVATAQIAGVSALAIAVTVKLTRVVLLAPLVATVALVRRARGQSTGARPPILPLFVVGFLVAAVLSSVLPLPTVVLGTADTAQTIFLGMALFALGSSIRLRSFARTNARAALVGLVSWAIIAALAFGAMTWASTTWA